MLDLKMTFRSVLTHRRVVDAAERARRRNLGYAAGYLRKVVRSSLRLARRKRLSELSKEERVGYEIQKRKAAEQGDPKPKRPFAHAEPGKPPRLQEKGSSLKQLILYAFDKREVVVGPAIKKNFSPTVPELLEYGGRAEHGQVEPRPFMAPGLDKTLPKFRDVWRDSVKG